MFICYKITNTINNKGYIGQTSKSIEDRWKRHVGAALWKTKDERNCHALHKAIRKYGPDVFKYEQLNTADTLKEILLIEKEMIVLHNTFTHNRKGYNMTLGGEGTVGYLITEQTRKKMSNSHKGKTHGPRPTWVKEKISQTKKEKGHGPSLYCNQRRSETGKGVLRPEDVKEKIRRALTGRKRPPEVIEKIKRTKALRKEISNA